MLKSVVLFYLILELSESIAEKYKVCSIYDAQQSCPNNAECLEEVNQTSFCKCDSDYKFNPKYKNDTDYCIYNPVILTLTTNKTKTNNNNNNNSNNNNNNNNNTTSATTLAILNAKTSSISNKIPSESNSNNNNNNDNSSSVNNNNTGNGSYSDTINTNNSDLSKNINNDKTASAIAMNQPPSSHHIIGGILIPIFLVIIIICIAYGVKRLNVIKRIRNIMVSRRNRPFYEDVMMNNDNDDPPLI